MPSDDLPSVLCTALMRVGTAITSGFDRYFATYNLTHAQFRTLLAVHAAGPGGLTPSALAEQLLLERTTVTAITTRLVNKGWMKRTPGENRRTLQLQLTPEGKQTLQTVTPLAEELAAKTLRPVPETSLPDVQRTLEAIEQALRIAFSRGTTPPLKEE